MGNKPEKFPCKRCAVEFEPRLPIDLYQRMVAAAEAEGEQMEFTGTCPDCRADDGVTYCDCCQTDRADAPLEEL
jgi:hypothetical protein